MTDLSMLPPSARRKYEGWQARLGDAHALLASIGERRKVYETRLAVAQTTLASLGDPGRRDEVKAKKLEAELAEINADLEHLDSDRAKRQAERDSAERVLTPLQLFLKSLWSAPDPYRAAPTALRSVVVETKLQDGETAAQALARVRRQISGVQSELGKLKSAPLPAAEVRAKVEAEIDALARQGCPSLNTKDGRLTWPDDAPSHSFGAPGGSARALLCWLYHDEVLKAATSGLDQEIPDSIAAAERPAREAQLRAELLRLEREEVALVTAPVAMLITAATAARGPSSASRRRRSKQRR